MYNETYMGYKVAINDDLMSTTIEDWTNVRSHSRAARRRKRGFKQRIVFRKVPKQEAYFLKEQNTIIMHSVFYNQLKKAAKDNGNYISEQYSNPPMGSSWRKYDGQYGSS